MIQCAQLPFSLPIIRRRMLQISIFVKLQVVITLQNVGNIFISCGTVPFVKRLHVLLKH